MTPTYGNRPAPASDQSSVIASHALTRITGSPLLRGNRVRLLRDARENYPAWLGAIDGAQRSIDFESYIIHEDIEGRLFVDRLINAARRGVAVRVIYDWLGGLGNASGRLWRRLRDAGVEVRCYNPFTFLSPLAWINRDHRKVLAVDGATAFVSGLCVGEMWTGSADGSVPPWRDTGIEIKGPGVREIDLSFLKIWNSIANTEDRLIDDEQSETHPEDVPIRVIASDPGHARVYRLDQVLGALARKSMWLTDAYFSATDSYVETLRAAARAGVDVKLLVPAANDIMIMSAIARSGYRALIENGVRVFEWNGPMIHSKTAVIDGYWSRIGSTNLNLSSFVGNAEIDILVEDVGFGAEMQEMFEQDLGNSTEIVISNGSHIKTADPQEGSGDSHPRHSGYAPSAVVIGSALTAAVYKGARKNLGTIEWKITSTTALLLISLSFIAYRFPKSVAFPFAFVCGWLALSLFVNAARSIARDGDDER